MEYISREDAIKELREVYEKEYPTASGDFDEYASHDVPNVLRNIPSADVQLVGRCKDCMYFKPAHVRCADGSEKAYSEFPEEAFEPNFGLGVTNEYGINVGSQCVYDEWCGGYIDDKTVFRKEDDFCSRFKSGARMDLKDGDSK